MKYTVKYVNGLMRWVVFENGLHLKNFGTEREALKYKNERIESVLKQRCSTNCLSCENSCIRRDLMNQYSHHVNDIAYDNVNEEYQQLCYTPA